MGSAQRNWARAALTLGQLALMGTNLVFSLSMAYGGGLSAVGATAAAVLVFQLTCGVLQRSFAEATLLRTANTEHVADLSDCRRSVTAAFGGGLAGTVVAVLGSLAVPDVPIELAVVYALGIPFAVGLDIGRAGGVAAGVARSVLVETLAWLTAQLTLMVTFAVLREPLAICASWTLVNVAFLVAAAGQASRRPHLPGLLGWLRARRAVMGPASIDAFLVGFTPLLAVQVTALVVGATTLGAIRVVQQLFAPLAFVSITFRRVLVYQRRVDAVATRGQDLRDGLVAVALMAAGAVVLGAAVLGGRGLASALSFIPVGGVLVAAGVEKAALGFSYGCSLGRFVQGEFTPLLRARYVMLGLTVIAAPLMTVSWGASGYLIGSAIGMLGYSAVVLALPVEQRPHAVSTTPVP
ncbi:MATE family efflux transporter [Micromonospora andamanensis]|uniref:hypothetical protein n=1 Tax=Micromonospora andamanensis TaxID=1287068 RepID=UPI0019521E1F|nr:hypothetical protein [Micromonospora andamanensis]